VNVTGANSKWINTGPLYVGGNSTASGGAALLNVSDSGFVAVGTTLRVWNNDVVNVGVAGLGTTATLRVSSDVSSPAPTERGIYVGSSTSVGAMDIVGGGAVVVRSDAPIASIDGLAGTLVTVAGQSSRLFLPKNLVVGSQYFGELKVLGGGAASVHVIPNATITDATIGLLEGSTGLVTVEGTVAGDPEEPSVLNLSSMVVGGAGDGRLTIKSGAKANTFAGAIVGNLLSLTGGGAVTVDGAGWDVFQELTVGNFGDGNVDIINGGSVTVGKEQQPGVGQMYIGKNNSGLPTHGIVTVDSNSLLRVLDDLTVADKGTGTLHIKNGADVENEESIIGFDIGSNGTVIVDNATWLSRKDLTVGLLGTGMLDIRNGGVVASAGTVRIGPNGTLKGIGTVTKSGLTMLVENNGTVASGSSPGTLNIDGNYTQGSAGKLQIELASATSHDVLAVTGQATLGGTLEITLLNGYMPAPTDTFNFLSSASRTGTFGNVVVAGNTGTFNVVFTATGVTLSSFTPTTGLPGDFNGNGKVDGADYVSWRNGSNPTQAQYNLWRTNFGRTSGSASGTSQQAAVPEPAVPGMLLIGLSALLSRPRRALPQPA
jgi:T5SS/PEP-CTERM-associated repeat protein